MSSEVKKRVSETMLSNGKRKRIGNETEAEVCRMREAGMVYEQIAKATGISLAQAHRISKHIPVGPRPGRRTLEKTKGVAS